MYQIIFYPHSSNIPPQPKSAWNHMSISQWREVVGKSIIWILSLVDTLYIVNKSMKSYSSIIQIGMSACCRHNYYLIEVAVHAVTQLLPPIIKHCIPNQINLKPPVNKSITKTNLKNHHPDRNPFMHCWWKTISILSHFRNYNSASKYKFHSSSVQKISDFHIKSPDKVNQLNI